MPLKSGDVSMRGLQRPAVESLKPLLSDHRWFLPQNRLHGLRLPRTAALVRLAHLAGAIAGRHRLRLGLKRHAVTQQRTTARRAVLATRDPCRTAAVQTHV